MKKYLNKYTHLVTLLLVILSISSCTTLTSESQLVEVLPASQLLNQTYGTATNQNYDIYLPANRTTATPVIIMLHGGFWRVGAKEEMNGFVTSAQLKLPDFAIVNTNYRLVTVGNNQFPTQLDDISILLNTLASKSADYQISQNYFLMGVSAGGHLALMYAYTRNTGNKIKAVVNIVGPTNLTDPAYTNSANPDLQQIANIILGDTFANNPTLYQNASPLTFVSANVPPTAQFFGGMDVLIPLSQGNDLKSALDAAGVPNEYTLYNNEGHGWIGTNLTDTENKITNFFNSLK
ncbi:MAG: alpha/beta hydrolase [Flavobacteriaceae bacterium]|nr:alpha/beta hydrolase [Flavobacteriaceae bacterium]